MNVERRVIQSSVTGCLNNEWLWNSLVREGPRYWANTEELSWMSFPSSLVTRSGCEGGDWLCFNAWH